MAKARASGNEAAQREGPGRSQRKRQAILDAATEVFLRDGYLGTNMEEIAALSEVSKQTIYKHFESKEALFVEIVSSMTTRAGDAVHTEIELEEGGDLSVRIPTIATTDSDGSRPPVPIDRDQCGAGACSAVGC